MRIRALIAASLIVTAPLGAMPAAAQGAAETARCDESAKIVMGAVQARKDGIPKSAARKVLREKLDRNAGDMLADWIWQLEDEQLTPAIGEAWKTQCLSQ
ncbi:MAG: hypothetical protein CML50_22190 [Rhodobacteraceae bacterium]|jgi:hypothetical protein|uniref:Uncharacterized protein n=1 Tax=Salipiger profundus TaxID=1229727 RepID=A0A1U7D5R9_9RHOB|nr:MULTISPECIES: hypothetical protein [Salipiger]APX23527.1 hypothetical protein Ga0080559_TMP2731 [Salipiger profundus]MAB08704.1 hypothetical protein [Paracoccaceae bacterium]GGA20893.1 hypothetical protein GCM10011326_36940 [Salipiger profundus]SFC78997.1 hypothetical protein SAMN05444415_10571 [Salipiger profundus]